MKYGYVFVLGRPGCGKSALYRELERQILESGRALTFERVDDFPKIWAKCQGDDALEREGKERIFTQRTDDGNYRVTNHQVMDQVLNEALKEVSSDVLRIDKPDHLVFIEFARSNYVEALGYFDRRILDQCMAIYMEVNFDICWARNVARHEAAIAKGGDDHLVPREVMEKHYLVDDQDAFVQHMKDQNIPVWVVNNEAEGKAHLNKQAEKLFEDLW